jgi:hypothetical protein
MNANDILIQVNTLMTRAGIAFHQAERAADRAQADALSTFARAARSRARFLMAKLG